MCYAELNMAMKVPYVQSRNSSSNLVYFLLLSLSLAVWPNVWPPVQSLEDSWGTKMPINIKKNRYSQETRISMTKTYEDPNIFWMSCFLLLVIILFFFFSSFLIFFVFPFYPQKHCFSWSKSSESLTLRIQVCPKKGINPTILLWGWDWDHQTYSREGYGSLGIHVSANYISYLLLEIDFCLYIVITLYHIHYIFFFTTLSDSEEFRRKFLARSSGTPSFFTLQKSLKWMGMGNRSIFQIVNSSDNAEYRLSIFLVGSCKPTFHVKANDAKLNFLSFSTGYDLRHPKMSQQTPSTWLYNIYVHPGLPPPLK